MPGYGYKERIRFNQDWGLAKQVTQRINLKVKEWLLECKLDNEGKDLRKVKYKNEVIVIDVWKCVMREKTKLKTVK